MLLHEARTCLVAVELGLVNQRGLPRLSSKRDGSRVWASGLMMQFEDENSGEHIGYLKIMRDRTPQHEARQRLNESEARPRRITEELQRLNESWETQVAAAHC